MALGRHLEQAIHESEKPRRKRNIVDVLKHVDVEDFLQSLDIENLGKSSADEYNFSCPFPGHTSGDRSPSAYMNDGSRDPSKATVWKCHGCNRAGNGISFLAEIERISNAEAMRFIKQTWAPGFRAPKGGSISTEFEMRLWERKKKSEPVVIPTIPWNDYHEKFGVDWDDAFKRFQKRGCPPEMRYMFERGFDVLTLKFWSIGYDELSERIVIPVSNKDGELVGIKGRAWKKNVRPKYRVLGDKENRRPRYGFMPYEKSLQVYGLGVWPEAKRLVLDEGELNVAAWWQMKTPAISSGSAHLSDEQILLIRDSSIEELIVCFDSNAAGDSATWGWTDESEEWHPGLVEKLAPYLHLRIVAEHDEDAASLMQTGRPYEALRLVETATSHHRILT